MIKEKYEELEKEISNLRLTKDERNNVEKPLKEFLSSVYVQLNALSEANKKLNQEIAAIKAVPLAT